MGNRAVITTSPFNENNIGIYVHWNGGRESIEGFLKAARELDYRAPGCDPNYAMAGLAGLIWSFLGTNGLSVCVGQCKDLDCDNGNNGTWLLGDDWSVAGHTADPFATPAKPVEGRFDVTKCDAIAADIVAKVNAAKAAKAAKAEPTA